MDEISGRTEKSEAVRLGLQYFKELAGLANVTG